ncbi:SH3 domain-containing protein [Actinacidiphila rubida]|uniref:SH3 domain-containing protein n=1 Tax=Actinacidiphila rubida TaxID=310780 RepID=A0A1H8J7A5_9ACTN|nr:SH3 domain-containing protein [Actinacidiphila rubida]SEN76067.1 SH3 domain-containing protein [Actinacidiphila rubida]
MTGFACRTFTSAALVAGSLAVGLLAPAAAGAAVPGHGHGGTDTTAAAVAAAPSAPVPPATPDSDRASGYVRGKVVSSVALRIRSRATTNSTALGSYAPGTIVKISCKAHGQNVAGNDLWYKLYDRTGYAAARYVQNEGAVPFC